MLSLPVLPLSVTVALLELLEVRVHPVQLLGRVLVGEVALRAAVLGGQDRGVHLAVEAGKKMEEGNKILCAIR